MHYLINNERELASRSLKKGIAS